MVGYYFNPPHIFIVRRTTQDTAGHFTCYNNSVKSEKTIHTSHVILAMSMQKRQTIESLSFLYINILLYGVAL